MNKHIIPLVLFGILVSWTLRAQGSFFTHIGDFEPDKIILVCEWDSLLAAKDNSSWDAMLKMSRKDSVEVWKAQLTVRGKFRRAKCQFPPLEVNLKKGALRKRSMAEFDKLKLVTHCNIENTDPADIFEELLIYKLFQLLTPYSFGVRSLRIDYQYTDGKTYLKNAPALILEPTAEVVHRVGGQELEAYSVVEDSLDATSYCRNALFQFMIGNFDWDLTMQQNVKMIGKPKHYNLVPYDFDFSAIVSPSYARIPTDYGLSDFRDRIYKGRYFEAQLPETMHEFLNHKELILNYVEDFDALSKSRRREIVKYLEMFFDFIADPDCHLTTGTILPFEK